MTTEFSRQYMVLKNISPVKITTATPLDGDALEVIKKKIASETTQQIQLATAVNPDLIGGFVLEANDQLFDASILRDLKDIKQQFNRNVYVSDLR
jgi:F-type H+-transporting ATPase subunit delta